MTAGNIFIFVVVLCTTIWVFIDAKSIGVTKDRQIKGLDMSPVGWVLACILLWIFFFPVYLSKRKMYLAINNPQRH